MAEIKGGPVDCSAHWEYELEFEGKPLKSLPPEKFRYFVIAFEGPNREISEIQRAADISIRELELGPAMITVPGGRGWNFTPGRLSHFLSSMPIPGQFCTPFLRSDAVELSSIYSRLKDQNKALLDIGEIASEIAQLRELPHHSHLAVLGYFAILEAQLTHPPKPTDPYDSITRQIKKKLTLLDNRWSPRIDYSPFGAAAPEKVWDKMYLYRSALAHGVKPNFKDDLQLLGTPTEHCHW